MSEEDYEWLAETAELSPQAAPSVAKVRLDNWPSTPNYTLAYAAAWQTLLPRAKELAIPILYLQRHSLELVLKDALLCLVSLRQELTLLGAIFGTVVKDGVADKVTEKAHWKLAHDGHRLAPLLAAVDYNLALLAWPGLPDDFRKAIVLFEALEREQASRLRYRTVPAKPKTLMQVESFEGRMNTPIIADLGETTRLMQCIVSDHYLFMDGEATLPSFMQALIDASASVRHDFLSRLDALESATRRDEVVWKLAEIPPLDINDFDEEDRERAYPKYLTASHAGRRYAIVQIRDGVEAESADGTLTRENAFYLAGQLDNGRLTRAVWPRWYESNLVPAACDSLRRHRGRTGSAEPSRPSDS
jgi:hypothetical protein